MSKKLLNCIGNYFPAPPKLIFSDTEKSVAYISKGNITHERKALKTLTNYYNSP